MGESKKLSILEDSKDIVPSHRKISIKDIQKNSDEEIKENFEPLTNKFLEHALEHLKQQDPNISKILEIPELKNIKLDGIDAHSNRTKIYRSIHFDGDLHELLLQHGFDKEQLKSFPGTGVGISSHGGFLVINIKYKKTS